MSDSPIAKKLQEMLNEEKWTRATLSGYTVNQIKELDALFHEAAREKVLDEARELCDEHLAHSKNSIAALYLSGILALRDTSGTKAGIDKLKKAIEVDPELGQAWRALAKAYRTRTKDQAAIDQLAKDYQARFGQPLP